MAKVRQIDLLCEKRSSSLKPSPRGRFGALGNRLLHLLIICLTGALVLTACEGTQLPTGVSPAKRLATPTPLSVVQQPGKIQVITAEPTAASPASPTPPPTARISGTPSAYDPVKVISSFGAQALGIKVSVPRVDGMQGVINLPQTASRRVSAAAAAAGLVAAGTVTIDNGPSGVAQVALGKGKVSGDLTLDISSASAGAFSFLSKAQPPAANMQALALIRQTFPALGSVMLTESSSSGGMYVFEGSFNQMGNDWKSRQSTMITTNILAGAGKMGPDTIVWAIVAKGELAAVK